jgi:hypothetical protein
MNRYDFREWILNQCCQGDKVELSKEQLDYFIPENSVEEMEAFRPFLAEKGLALLINKKRHIFMFVLEESESCSGIKT